MLIEKKIKWLQSENNEVKRRSYSINWLEHVLLGCVKQSIDRILQNIEEEAH